MLKQIPFILAGVFIASTANAATITFDDWVYNNDGEDLQADWLVTIDDTSNPDYFTFTVDIGDDDVLGDITAFGFNTDVDYGSDFLDSLQDYSSVGFGDCARSCNWNGTDARNPDYAFTVGSNGGTDFNTTFSFGLPSFGLELTEDTFELVAIRAQSLGVDGEGSSKDYSVTAQIAEVPELNASQFGLAAAFALALFGLSTSVRRPS